ncbi:MAG: energy-coupling factor ABC transporter ATP-binding protein [Candidatus Methanomethylicia archaeon]|jgi:energy-coupling factor transport system ATP-binding protein|nr:energy-coupling factor ABC transporter ATP-binding protein [Candidatus Methanomethylicia archaeon]NHV60666.1 ABC transporter ATP-binding protein [Candidatus Verstraetearchaeota archaeon]
MGTLIEFEGVEYTYPNGNQALKDVSLKINRGESVAIMGENGAGKTTMAKLMLGLIRPTRGRVLIDGADTRESTTAKIARKVGYIFQNPLYQLFSDTVEREVALGPRAMGMEEKAVAERVSATLRELGLEHLREMPPLSLSEGERKRVAIASVLSMDPHALIIDEPTLGQDEAERVRLIQILRRQLDKGKSVIIISHDVDFAYDVAERFVIMKRGRVLGILTKAELLRNREMLEEANLVMPQLLDIAEMLERNGMLENNPVKDVRELAAAIISAIQGEQK